MAKKKMQPSAAGFVEVENKAVHAWETKDAVAVESPAEQKPSRKKAEKKAEPVEEPAKVEEPVAAEEPVVLEAEKVATEEADAPVAE